ncbi:MULTISPECIES: RluA family pseudouridine synthase [unclassified Lentimicrobium]|uniref:RluA family pseudouridine synthase n=1 Tax=unclassified Lentimicrobium TaxID=2677434 RepID=UPI001555B532|nr:MULTISPECIES: RluA family pseudouridine synthase [unclassified Lentimicrobium]NPD45257.1 RluA family pseudouridine synthase [Lentimicrobium sp. S6]NPD86207.1 RluA family pseudouridine synthase [Lentimicrobium sp. L6]
MLELVESKRLPKLEDKLRLSDLPAGMFQQVSSRKAFKNAITNGLVHLDGRQAYTADYVSGGEQIEIFKDANHKIKPTIDLKLEVLFEDEYLAVVNKPAGILVSGNKKWTLENTLSSNLTKSNKEGALEFPEPIHRLDYPTSGVLLIGKTKKMVILLNHLFEERQVRKIYHAVTIGKMDQEGVCESEIENKVSKSTYQVLSSLESPKYGFLNLVQLSPHTGRRHQLRIHMAEMGNPIFGDLKYGAEGLISKGNGLFLHASSLRFVHPVTGLELYIEKSLHTKFLKIFPNG